VDFGHVGDITSVDISLIVTLFKTRYVPVVASLAADQEGSVYNVNADTIARALAAALEAARLVLLTNVPGIMLDPSDPSTVLPFCTPARINALLSAGIIFGGMVPKVQNCIDALHAGIRSVQILDGSIDKPQLLDSLIGGGAGTLITNDAAYKPLV
jgi:acetylglutamate kinase